MLSRWTATALADVCDDVRVNADGVAIDSRSFELAFNKGATALGAARLMAVFRRYWVPPG